MANVCDFYITAHGDEDSLRAIIDFLKPGIEDCPGGYYGAFILELDKLFTDWDVKEMDFVGLSEPYWEGDPAGRGVERWCRLVLSADLPPTTNTEADPRAVEVVAKLGLDAHSDDDATAAADQSRTYNFPCLAISGATKWAPPGPLVERLSKMWPKVRFEYGGTTEHTHSESWECVAGESRCIEMYDVDISGNGIFWHFRDGIEIEKPEWEYGEPPEWVVDDDADVPPV